MKNPQPRSGAEVAQGGFLRQWGQVVGGGGADVASRVLEDGLNGGPSKPFVRTRLVIPFDQGGAVLWPSDKATATFGEELLDPAAGFAQDGSLIVAGRTRGLVLRTENNNILHRQLRPPQRLPPRGSPGRRTPHLRHLLPRRPRASHVPPPRITSLRNYPHCPTMARET